MIVLEGGVSSNDSKTKWCLFCDKEWKIDEKLDRLSRWSWRPRTWIYQAVILLSILNLVFAHNSLQYIHSEDESEQKNEQFSSQWAVHIVGGEDVANQIATKHGFINLGKIFEDFYHFEHKKLQKRSLAPHVEFHKNLTSEDQVKWAQQQIVKKRSKRDLITHRSKLKASSIKFNDAEWPQMWYLNRGEGLDMNVEGAWKEGISGTGVVVTILDDGLEKNHPDLSANYDPQASYDVNNHDEDPMPRYDHLDTNRHGTRCAGEVAAVANNSLCSVGVAFGASVGGVRMLDGDVTDAVEARSLSLNPQHIDIYSASWGPDDDGKTVDGPGELATRAFIEGVTKGRQGKGSIFVWASGNGGRDHDNCNCDGYTNSIWTLSISSATENGLVPWYSEACSSTLATTYSSGSNREKQIVTTDLRHRCTSSHTGTSASAPLAAGICALALEANRDLTWRDMQHIVVRTARPANLKSPDWKVNGVGRNVSHSFGYGLMDATAMVRLARTWKTVPEQHQCEVSAPDTDKLIPPRSKVILSLNVTECAGVNFLEHVQAKISLSSSRRGDLQIYLTSPAGTRSTLLARRPQDTSRNPFNAWPFMSVHTWGEMPFGVWQLEIHNQGKVLGRANLQQWSLIFYGTLQNPVKISNGKSSQPSSPKLFNKASGAHNNSKSGKSSSTSSTYFGRKNQKNWKTKMTTSRIGKITEPSANPPKSSKTTQRFWILSKVKGLAGGKSYLKTTAIPPATQSLPLTIVLGPNGDLTNPQKVPDVFQKYPKVQQLFPLFLNTSRLHEDAFSFSKVGLSSIHLPKSSSKIDSYSTGQKAERQNRFDTSPLTRTSTEGKTLANHKTPLSEKQRNQGKFDSWQMLFYGTEEPPYPDFSGGNGRNYPKKGSVSGFSTLKGSMANKGGAGEEVSNDLGSESSVEGRGGGWKEQATRRDEVTRTTMDPLASSSSGCISYKQSIHSSTGQCLECVTGLYLYKGSCEAICPPKTYPDINAKEKAACMPCHYTCLTCAGESDAHCTSCYDEAVRVPSGEQDSREFKGRNLLDDGILLPKKPDTEVEDLPEDEEGHLSWGRRSIAFSNSSLFKFSSSGERRAVTKKILEPYIAPRPLFFCYPSRMMKQIETSLWYYRMTVLFAINLTLLIGILGFLIWRKICFKQKATGKMGDMAFKYLKMKNGNSSKVLNDSNILYISSSSEEE